MNGSHCVVDNGTANVSLKPLALLFCYHMHWNIDEPPSTPSMSQIFASDRWTLWYYLKPNKQDCLLLTEAVQLCRPCCFKAHGEKRGEHPAQWTGCHYFHLTASCAQFLLLSSRTALHCCFVFSPSGDWKRHVLLLISSPLLLCSVCWARLQGYDLSPFCCFRVIPWWCYLSKRHPKYKTYRPRVGYTGYVNLSSAALRDKVYICTLFICWAKEQPTKRFLCSCGDKWSNTSLHWIRFFWSA